MAQTPSCDRLAQIAEAQRNKMIIKNTYSNQDGRIYNETHPNATQQMGGTDDPSNAKGKGTGIYLDTTNGGSSVDINGLPQYYHSGRKAIQQNMYTSDSPYDCFLPDSIL